MKGKIWKALIVYLVISALAMFSGVPISLFNGDLGVRVAVISMIQLGVVLGIIYVIVVTDFMLRRGL